MTKKRAPDSQPEREIFARNLKKFRVEAGLSQRELAKVRIPAKPPAYSGVKSPTDSDIMSPMDSGVIPPGSPPGLAGSRI